MRNVQPPGNARKHAGPRSAREIKQLLPVHPVPQAHTMGARRVAPRLQKLHKAAAAAKHGHLRSVRPQGSRRRRKRAAHGNPQTGPRAAVLHARSRMRVFDRLRHKVVGERHAPEIGAILPDLVVYKAAEVWFL